MSLIIKTRYGGEEIDIADFISHVTTNTWMLREDGNRLSLEVDWDRLFPSWSAPDITQTCRELTGGGGIPGYAFDAVEGWLSHCGLSPSKSWAISEPDYNHPSSMIIITDRELIKKMAEYGINVLSRVEA